MQIHSIEPDAKYIRRNEAELLRPKTNNTHHSAINCCHNPSFPATPSHQDGRTNRKHTGQV